MGPSLFDKKYQGTKIPPKTALGFKILHTLFVEQNFKLCLESLDQVDDETLKVLNYANNQNIFSQYDIIFTLNNPAVLRLVQILNEESKKEPETDDGDEYIKIQKYTQAMSFNNLRFVCNKVFNLQKTSGFIETSLSIGSDVKDLFVGHQDHLKQKVALRNKLID